MLAKNARANTSPKNDGDGQGPTDDVTSGMQGACDGLLTHIFHCDTIGSAPVCTRSRIFPPRLRLPLPCSSWVIRVGPHALIDAMHCAPHLVHFPFGLLPHNTLPLPTIHFPTYTDTLSRKTATVRRTPTSSWLPRPPIRARLRHSVRSRVPSPSRVATTFASKVLWSPGPIATSPAWPFGWTAPTIGSPWPPGGAPSLPR